MTPQSLSPKVCIGLLPDTFTPPPPHVGYFTSLGIAIRLTDECLYLLRNTLVKWVKRNCQSSEAALSGFEPRSLGRQSCAPPTELPIGSVNQENKICSLNVKTSFRHLNDWYSGQFGLFRQFGRRGQFLDWHCVVALPQSATNHFVPDSFLDCKCRS